MAIFRLQRRNAVTRLASLESRQKRLFYRPTSRVGVSFKVDITAHRISQAHRRIVSHGKAAEETRKLKQKIRDIETWKRRVFWACCHLKSKKLMDGEADAGMGPGMESKVGGIGKRDGWWFSPRRGCGPCE